MPTGVVAEVLSAEDSLGESMGLMVCHARTLSIPLPHDELEIL